MGRNNYFLVGHLEHEVLDDSVELAPLVVHRDALGRVALVSLAQVQEVGARLRAGVGVQLERDALNFLVPNLVVQVRMSDCARRGGGRGVSTAVVNV